MREKIKIRTIPTIIGLFVLVIGITSGVFLVRENTSFLSKASPESNPKQVNTTNITDSSFTISWITDEASSGFIKFGQTDSLEQIARDDRDQASGQTGEFITHHITAKGLKADTDYKFKISSNGKTYDNNGQAYSVKTAQKIASNTPASDIAYGTVNQENGTPVEGAIVYLSLNGATKQSTLTKASGSWVIPLNLAFSSTLSGYVEYDKANSKEEIYVNAGNNKIATATTTTGSDSPVPLITIGENKDFQDNQPLPTPTPTEIASRGGLSTYDLDQTPVISQVTITNPQEGEKINTQNPEFLGKGPAGTTLEITLESNTIVTDQTTVTSNNDWSWSPSTSLEAGAHTLTISYTDSSGEKKTLERNFTVLASGESSLPALSATPSADLTTPTPTLTPTPTPTPTPSARSSVPSTDSGVPVSGNLTPTLMLVIMGLGLIIFGLFAKNLSKIND